MTNRSATPVLFGFDFQANAAIVLMLENIKYMTSIRLEGYEDIEINLNDGSSVLAQAKAVVNSSTDFSNVISNLKNMLVFADISKVIAKPNIFFYCFYKPSLIVIFKCPILI